MSAGDASRAAASVDALPSAWIAHKIDSTLRGNWAAELTARQRVTGRRVVVLPGWPELGRTCIGGEVFVDGVGIGNVRRYLPDADLLADAGELQMWLDGDSAIAICDVPSTDAMHAAANVLVSHDVLIAGPAGPLGAAFTTGRSAVAETKALIAPPVLVVCGSANPVSREQLRRLAVSRADVALVATSAPEGALHHAAVLELVAQAAVLIAEVKPQTLVIIGGETAAELLGPAPRLVTGFAATGMPASTDEYGAGPLVITKAGGFGSPSALVDLIGRKNG